MRFEDLDSWGSKATDPFPAMSPKAVDAAMEVKAVTKPIEVAAVLKTYRAPFPVWPLLFGVMFGFVVGYATHAGVDRIDRDHGSQVEPDDKKKQATVEGDMILIAETGKGMSPEIFEFERKLRTFCESKGVQFRSYDKDLAVSLKYIDFAKGAGVSIPFVAFRIDGKIASAKSVSDMEGVIK